MWGRMENENFHDNFSEKMHAFTQQLASSQEISILQASPVFAILKELPKS